VSGRLVATALLSLGLLTACATPSRTAIRYARPGTEASTRQQDEIACLRTASQVDDEGYLLLPFQIDRAAFDRATDGVRVGHSGIDRAESDGAGPDHPDDGADVRSLVPGPRMPLSSETSGLGPQEPAERVPPSWPGWWAGTDPARPGSADTDTRPDGPAATITTSTEPARPNSGAAPKAGAASAARFRKPF